MKLKHISSISICVAALSYGSIAQASIVQNGGFVPAGGITQSAYIGLGNSNTYSVSDWTVTSGPGGDSLMFVVPDGTAFSTNMRAQNPNVPNFDKPISLYSSPGQTVNSDDGSGWYIVSDADPQYGGKISQTLTGLTPGQEYAVTFSQAAGQQNEPFPGFWNQPTTSQWQVSFGGSSQFSTWISQAGQAPVSAWQKQTLTFTADASSQVLSFLGNGAPSGQPPYSLLSGVSVSPVNAVPEPFTILGTATALGFGAFFKRQLKNKKSKHDDNV